MTQPTLREAVTMPPLEAGIGALAGLALWFSAAAFHIAMTPSQADLLPLLDEPLFWVLATGPLLIGGLGWIAGDRRRERQEAFALYQSAVDGQFADLAEREWVTRAVVQNAFDAVLILELDGAILDANPTASRIFGHSMDHLITLDITALLPDHDRLNKATVVDRRTAGGERLGVEWRTRARHADGSVFSVDLHISMLPEPGLLVYAVRDSTTRISQEARMVSDAVTAEKDRSVLAQRARGTVMLDVGLHLREHLARVLTQAEALRELDEAGTLGASIHEEVSAAWRWVEQLWNLTAWERATASPTLSPASVGELVDEVVDALGPLARQEGVRLHIRLDDGIGHLITDVPKLAAAMRNVIGHSCMRARHDVKVEVKRDPGRGTDWLAMFVRDDGEPLSDDVLNAVVGAYAQEEMLLEPPRGTEAGSLALAQRLARSLGGHIAVEAGPSGNEFSLRLPMDPSKVKDVPFRPPPSMETPDPSPVAE